MLTRIDHVGIACRNLAETTDLYCATFGLTVVSHEVNEDQGVREAMLRVATGADGSELAGGIGGIGGAGGADLRAAEAGPEAVPPDTDLRAAAGGSGPGHPGGSGAESAGPAGPGGLVLAAPVASYIQLLEPLRADSPVGKFLDRRGEGLHHIGYGVTDIRAALAQIGATGIRLIDERPRHGSMGASIAFLHPADLGGVLTELVQCPDPGDAPIG